jgi:major membrane immunogen (membrane-anchored lipoprotein)
MKKTIRIVALMLVLVMSVCALASCGKKLSGKYEGKLEVLGQSVSVTYDFSGSKVEITTKATILGSVNTETEEAEYEIVENDDGTMEITFITVEDGKEVKDTLTFEEGEDYIKLGGIQYNKVK